MQTLTALVQSGEQKLLEKIQEYAVSSGYMEYASIMEEAWRMSVAGISTALREFEQTEKDVPKLGPGQDYQNHPGVRFVIMEAKKHRTRGVSLEMFLGMMKYFRQGYVDLILGENLDRTTESGCLLTVNRFFDWVEIGLCSEWAGRSQDDLLGELQRENRAVNDEKNKYLTVFDSMPCEVFLLNERGELDNANCAGMEMVREGKAGESIKNTRLERIFPWLKGEISAFQINGKREITFEKEVESLGGGKKTFLVKFTRLRDVGNRFRGMIVIFNDLTEQKKVAERIHYNSIHDGLTDLFNRTFFEQEINRLENEGTVPCGIIVCDLDGLKLVNDTLGHKAGDILLKNAAQVIQKSFRQRDAVARIGGDEFAIILPGAGLNQMERSLKRICRNLAQYNKKNPQVPLRMSVGYAIRKTPEESLNRVFKEADNNMYREKLYSSTSSRSAIVQTLVKTLEARGIITEGHSIRLQKLVSKMAAALNMPEQKITPLKLLAQFHDIGKVGIPDKILFKPGIFTQKEYAEMQRHCEIGYRIALASPGLAHVADWILKHHEWWNGLGYPLGLKGEEIPLECRILAIVDAYDSMTMGCPHRKAMSREAALEELKRFAGKQFDPDLVPVFMQILPT